MNANPHQEDKRAFYRRVFTLVLPLALQNLINVGVNAADILMLGRLGEVPLSASSIAGQIFFIFLLLLFGLSSGMTVLTSQYWGKRDIQSITRVMSIALRFAIVTSILFLGAALAFPYPLMRVFSGEADVIKEAVSYLRIVAFSYLFISVTLTYLNTLRSMERVVISTVVYSVSLVINVVLNALLIFGLLGFPKMGIRGAAVATLTARIVEFVIVIVHAKRNHAALPFHLRDLFRHDRLLFKDFVKFSTPVIANELFWGSAIAMTVAVLGHLGKSAVAANSVTQVTRQLATVVTFGVANATAIVVGKAIGEGYMDKAKTYASRFAKLSLLTGVAGSVVMLVARPIALHFLTLTPTAKGYLSFMMYVMAYFIICQSYNATMIVGNFRAGGDTKIGLLFDVASLWLFALPFGALAAFVFHWPVPIVYLILTSDELVKLIPSTIHFRSYKWLNSVTR